MSVLGIFLAFVVLGCGGEQVPPNTGLAPSFSSTSHVYLFRGFTGHWSKGLDTIASRLNVAGFGATVLPHSAWRRVLANLLADPYPGQRLVLIGHSWGADDAIRLAAAVHSRGRAVRLLITLDPVTPPAVPSNVRQAFNFYESNPPRDWLPWWRGVPLRATDGSTGAVHNYNLHRDRRDLGARDITHGTITDAPVLQQEIVRLVGAALESTGSDH